MKRIEQIMSNFLWNSRGESRVHWVSWDSVCSPKDEGVRGVRRLVQVQQGLHGKLMWSVLQGTTLWGRFARAKYFRGNRYVAKHSSSPLWNSIASHESRLRHIGRWVIGRGDVSFWNDNWLGENLRALYLVTCCSQSGKRSLYCMSYDPISLLAWRQKFGTSCLATIRMTA